MPTAADRDTALGARALRWWKHSGARAHWQTELVDYTTWAADASNDVLVAADLEQIEKDVGAGRTDARIMADAELRRICATCTRVRLSRLLVALVRHSPLPGYAQGLNLVAALLLAGYDALWRCTSSGTGNDTASLCDDATEALQSGKFVAPGTGQEADEQHRGGRGDARDRRLCCVCAAERPLTSWRAT